MTPIYLVCPLSTRPQAGPPQSHSSRWDCHFCLATAAAFALTGTPPITNCFQIMKSFPQPGPSGYYCGTLQRIPRQRDVQEGRQRPTVDLSHFYPGREAARTQTRNADNKMLQVQSYCVPGTVSMLGTNLHFPGNPKLKASKLILPNSTLLSFLSSLFIGVLWCLTPKALSQ